MKHFGDFVLEEKKSLEKILDENLEEFPINLNKKNRKEALANILEKLKYFLDSP